MFRLQLPVYITMMGWIMKNYIGILIDILKFTIPEMDLMLFRPKDKILRCFMLPKLEILSMLLDDSDNFL